ncbi:hypothetical protein [Streptomyces goshikiensis]|uniref:hypothetical protein n=1 Tax=Streptomyces goshikiensis TaxID=1942 RepID=UPI0038195F73
MLGLPQRSLDDVLAHVVADGPGPDPRRQYSTSKQPPLVSSGVPALCCLAPVRVNDPLGAEVSERLLAWVQRVGGYELPASPYCPEPEIRWQ